MRMAERDVDRMYRPWTRLRVQDLQGLHIPPPLPGLVHVPHRLRLLQLQDRCGLQGRATPARCSRTSDTSCRRAAGCDGRAPQRSEGPHVSGWALLAAGAIALGLGAGWALSGRIVTVAILAVLIAAGNGYSKAYSP